MMKLKPSTIGWIITVVIALLGVIIGAPIEAVLVLIAIGTTIEFLFLRERESNEPE